MPFPLFALMAAGTPALVGLGVGGAFLVGLYPPTRRDLGGAPDLDDEAERVRIPLLDGDSLDGWYLPGTRPQSVLMLHGFGRTHHRVWRYASFLRPAGYGLLAIDFRSSRRHRRLPTTLGSLEQEEALAAAIWLSERSERVFLLGESLGATVALLTAARLPEITGVVVDCPFAAGRHAVEDMLGRFLRLPVWPSAEMARALGRWATGHDVYSVDALSAAAILRERPILFIHSQTDERLSPDQSQWLWEAAGSKDPTWWVPEAGHNEGWKLHRAEYERRVLEFLAGVGMQSPLVAEASQRIAELSRESSVSA
jgi:pimeloyl-ACP methyl ester carboxylesterase